jgi:hypothetical protein
MNWHKSTNSVQIIGLASDSDEKRAGRGVGGRV